MGETFSERGNFEVKADDVRAIDVVWLAGSVDISADEDGSQDSIVGVERFSGRESDDHRMTWELDDGVLRISYGAVSWGFFGCSSSSKRLELTLPKSLSETLETVDLTAASGEYSMNGFGCKSMKIDLASGNLNGAGLSMDDLDLDMASGVANIAADVFNELDVNMASGTVTLDSGNVCPYRTDIDLMSGLLDLRVAHPEKGVTLDLDKLSGNFNCDFAGAQWLHDDEGMSFFGEGESVINVSMSSGNVSIHDGEEG